MIPGGRSSDRIRAMIRSRKGEPDPQRQKFATDIDLPFGRAAIESGGPSPMEMRTPPPSKPARKPLRTDAPPAGGKKRY
jgi:hypothetical protein